MHWTLVPEPKIRVACSDDVYGPHWLGYMQGLGHVEYVSKIKH